MNYPDARRWVKFTFTRKKRHVMISYEDGLGNKVDAGDPKTIIQEKTSTLFRNVLFKAPSIIEAFLDAMLREPNNNHLTSEGLKTIPIPVFINSEEFTDLHSSDIRYFEFIFERLIGEFFPIFKFSGDVQLLYHLDTKEPKIFELPITIRYEGRTPIVADQIVNEANWYDDPAVKQYGFQISTGFPVTITDPDILIVQDQAAEVVLRPESWKNKPSPLLLIIMDTHPILQFSKVYSLVKMLSCPCLHISTELVKTGNGFLKEFIYCIIHDFALHEALHHSRKKWNLGISIDTILYASPASNQNLRMHRAMESFQNKVNSYVNVISPGDTNDFVNKLDLTSPETRSAIHAALSNMSGSEAQQFQNLSTFTSNFNSESRGLAPLARKEEEFHLNRSKYEQIKTSLDTVVNDKEIFHLLRERQQRHVNITLHEFDSFLLFRPVNPLAVLQPNRDYRLNVSIGQRSQHSLVRKDVPSIDPLLPDPQNGEGHTLSIVVFAKDFTLLSKSSKDVYLPLLGGTGWISFNIRTPDTTRFAELRIAVFHKNSLLQGFLLRSQIGGREDITGKETVTVELDLAASANFTNIDKLPSPDLYIGMNKNVNKSHSLFIKKDSHVLELGELTEAVYDKAQQGFRKLLTDAYFKENQSKLTFDQVNKQLKFLGDFAEVVRKFGRFGFEYYQKIFSSGGQRLEDLLKEISRGHHPKKIQIGRHNPNHSFPWAILYDFDAPPSVTGMNNLYPICYGTKFTAGEHDLHKNKPGYGCPHNPDTHTWCVDGFWGTRNIIEQLFGASTACDAEDEVINTGSGIFYSCNVQDTFTAPLTLKMATYQPTAKIIGAESNLMDDLWNDALRPSSLIILGHLEKKEKQGEPACARIMTFPHAKWNQPVPIPHDKWITSELIFKYRKITKWKKHPLPLVFLINCSSGDLNIDSLNLIVEEFYRSGASAVIATECDINTGLGTRFIEKIIDSLYQQHKPLGEAIREFNRDLFMSGIPLAFVFTCYGNSKLTIKHS